MGQAEPCRTGEGVPRQVTAKGHPPETQTPDWQGQGCGVSVPTDRAGKWAGAERDVHFAGAGASLGGQGHIWPRPGHTWPGWGPSSVPARPYLAVLGLAAAQLRSPAPRPGRARVSLAACHRHSVSHQEMIQNREFRGKRIKMGGGVLIRERSQSP